MNKTLQALFGGASLSLALLLAGCGGGASSSAGPGGAIANEKVVEVAATGETADKAASPESGTTLLAAHDKVRTMTGAWISTTRKPISPSSSMPAIPVGTWQPPAGSVPDSGDALYIESAGQPSLFAAPNATITLNATGTDLIIGNAITLGWQGRLRALRGQKQWQTGYYPGAFNYPASSMSHASMNWRSNATSCSTASGWIAVDNVAYSANQLVRIELRLEQQCEGSSWVVRGKLRWTAPGSMTPPAVPADLWQPAAGATPLTGNYVYLESDAGDYVGHGNTFLYTPQIAALNLMLTDGYLRVHVDGDQWWYGDFQAMTGVSPLQSGYYPRLQRYPFHDPARGGLSWYGDGRGCNTLTGWFAVDNISVTAGVLTAVDLRFEQHCEGWSQALRGKIHWRSDDTTTPPGPQNPPPADLWKPAAGATPASGSFVYLESTPGDWVGGGATRLFTPGNANMRANVGASSRVVQVQVQAGSSWWDGSFEAMDLLNRLQPGFYANAFRFPFNNPTRPGLSWTGEGHGCNESRGWFVVDAIAFEGNLLTALDARFEQYCDGATAPLRGQVHWTID
ncbi:hypothetical protein [Hydrogenophaga sp. RWCD_12]|uniref:hypothetical protein n=1 Tax=Hydrogenophaga sp. RWCD_12 TaxID=3391190 RepID=UPI003985514B